MSIQPIEIEHYYGKNIHLLDNPYLQMALGKLSTPDFNHPELHYTIRRIYEFLLQSAVNYCFPVKQSTLLTRMAERHPEQGQLKIEHPTLENHNIVIANLLRAGAVPSHYCYDELNHFFEFSKIRHDYIILNRTVDSEEHVTGTHVNGTKIGGPIDNAFVFLPDPMGATGSTISRALETYKPFGKASKWIALHLIVTPEYIQHVKNFENLEVFALRLDRGFSSPEALKQAPGKLAEQEKGLNEKDYIVPGAGGLGELLNNSYI